MGIKRFSIIFFSAMVFVFATSCGGGNEPDPAFSISGTVTFADVDFFPVQQNVIFGLFNPGDIQPIHSVAISKPTGNSAEFIVENVEDGNYEMAVYISENIIRKTDLVNYGNLTVNNDVQLPGKQVTFISYSRVQEQVFSSCLLCHGGTQQTAAGLNLYPEHSYSLLVNHESVNSENYRVKPNSAGQSFLIQILKKESLVSEHGSITATAGDIELVTNWINTGAKND
ncbi:MAG: hypothetical protein ACK5HT_18370 [Draconibacterium sp.]